MKFRVIRPRHRREHSKSLHCSRMQVLSAASSFSSRFHLVSTIRQSSTRSNNSNPRLEEQSRRRSRKLDCLAERASLVPWLARRSLLLSTSRSWHSWKSIWVSTRQREIFALSRFWCHTCRHLAEQSSRRRELWKRTLSGSRVDSWFLCKYSRRVQQQYPLEWRCSRKNHVRERQPLEARGLAQRTAPDASSSNARDIMEDGEVRQLSFWGNSFLKSAVHSSVIIRVRFLLFHAENFSSALKRGALTHWWCLKCFCYSDLSSTQKPHVEGLKSFHCIVERVAMDASVSIKAIVLHASQLCSLISRNVYSATET